MTIAARTSVFFATIIAVAALSLLFVPHPASALLNQGDLVCVSSNCTIVKAGPNDPRPICATVQCPDSTSGFTTMGTCQTPTTCKAISTSGPNGFGTQMLQQILGSLFQKLMQGSSGSGSGSGSGSTPIAPAGATGCSSYTPTSDVSQVYTSQTGGPCYYYQAPVSSQLNIPGLTGGTPSSVSDQLNALTNTNPDTSVSSQLNALTNPNTNPNTNTNTNTNTNVSDSLNTLTAQVTSVVTSNTTPTTTLQVVVPQGVVGGLTSGVSGDIQVLGNGGTILAGSVDANNNSVTAGFFGGDTMTGQPTGVIANLCRGRPWASNFLSYILPPSFFDSLCALRGYQVGQPQPVLPTVTIIQSAPKRIPAAPVATTSSGIAPRVSIWAVPASVPLGSRTSVFWNSQGVTNCDVTSPDGSFSQTSLSGGASTVALTGATTFTISCIAPDGSHVTDYVTVNLSI